MSTIITRNSANSGSTPSSLVQGELAINVTDGRLFYGSGSGNVVKEFTGSASGGATNTGSLLTTASFLDPNLTFTKGNGSTFNVNISSLTVTSASYAATVSFITSSGVYGPYGSNSILTASYADTASFSTAASANQILVLNQSGQNIAKGTVVHITASVSSGDTPHIITASYENDNNSANTLGITSQLIANGSTGFVTTEGVVTGINTNAFQSGQLVYLGATGSITGSAPSPPLHSVRLGQVIRHQSNNGSIYVRVDNGYELGELHDVKDTTTSSSYGDLLVKSGSVWTTGRQLTGSYGLTGSLGQGLNVKASGSYSHAEGNGTQAIGNSSHAEGIDTQAIEYASHAEGDSTFALGISSHTEGFNTVANREDYTTPYLSGSISYSGSGILYATGNVSSYPYGHYLAWYHGIDFVYYSSQISSSTYDAINGFTTINLITAPTPTDDTVGGGLIILQNTNDSSYSHAEGYQTVALGFASHAEGYGTIASGSYSHAEGGDTRAIGDYSRAEGAGTQAKGNSSHAEGKETTAIGDYSHAEGTSTQTGITTVYSASVSAGLVILDASYGDISTDFSPGSLLYLYDTPFDFAYGAVTFTISSSTYTTQTEVQLTDVTAATTKAYVGDLSNIGTWSGDQTIPGLFSHAEGEGTKAIGYYSHAEGRSTAAIGSRSHAEGYSTQAIGGASHAEGEITQAIGFASHAEGYSTQAIGYASHAEGTDTRALGDYSHAEGIGTIASGSYQHAQGTYNTHGNTTSLMIIGNGVNNNNRSDLALFNTDGIQFTQPVTGSIFSGSFTGSLNGTASFAVSASWAPGSGGVTINNNTNNYLLTATGTSNTINGESNLTFDGTFLLLTGSFSHGSSNTAIGQYSHAEGGGTQANGAYSHAEGYKANASGQYSHAEGDTTQAKGFASHAEGDNTIASGSYSHAEGQNTVALGTASYAAGLGTVAKFDYQYVIGKYNSESSALFAVGNGTSTLSTSNLALFNTNGIEFTQPLTASIISGSAFTGSLFGIATSASYVNGMITKNNAIAAGSFTGNPRKATVTFTTPFPNTNYTVTVTGEDSRTWTIESKLSGSFVISSNSSVALTGNTYWQAISYGEFNS